MIVNPSLAKLLVMSFSSFGEVTSYLDSFSYMQTSTPGLLREARLERMSLLLDALSHPEESFKAVHVAGSKGKGSTCCYLSALLTAAGHRTGLYLSPHLCDYRERFSLNGTFFDDSLLISIADRLEKTVRDFSLPPEYGQEKPSTFELYTAYAYMLFKAAGCEYAVIETGLGGRLDATNTLDPVASIITPIELEHTSVLGSTIEKIATEKSKIIKKNRPVFLSMLKMDAMQVMKKEAERQNSVLYSLSDELMSLKTDTRECGEVCTFSFADGYEASLVLSMHGEVQAENAALALLTARRLGFYVKGESEKALEKAALPGRFEMHSYKGKPVVMDVCHTKVSTMHTVSSFTALYPQRNSNACIFAAIDGKDIEGMLSIILPSFRKVVISKPDSFRKSDSRKIYEKALAMKSDDNIVVYEEECRSALDEAVSDSSAVLIAGSFYLASRFGGILEC